MGRSSRAEVRRRVADIYGLVVDGLPTHRSFDYIAANCTWKVSERTIDNYIARARKQMIEESRSSAPRSSPSRWRVSSASSHARAPATS